MTIDVAPLNAEELEESKRGNWFAGRTWALCWCRLSLSAKVHRLARTRKGRIS